MVLDNSNSWFKTTQTLHNYMRKTLWQTVLQAATRFIFQPTQNGIFRLVNPLVAAVQHSNTVRVTSVDIANKHKIFSKPHPYFYIL